ncbi:heme ABC exporter ATP-binding protein CcmA [Qipengyuania thermophila]|uniref:heme ABC exporter ATP-binding protein CcmA n=1 Tax=Qipengyuania thermophila TaxID=2509361 RepID=UPI0028F459A8|nr:heme ABC exporter ATP-binding protein CcmA [Qipengyuania thermophila]
MARDIACRRGDRLLFRGLDLTLLAGDAVHVRGPNGCGKTSLLRILAGLLRPFAGAVERSASLGLVDDRCALPDSWTLGQALGFWSRIDRGPVPAAAAADRLGIAPLLHVPVRFLSTGQRRRAALARLLGQSAQVWLLDEPFNGLDADGETVLTGILQAHRDAGGSVVLTAHRMLPLASSAVLDLPAHAPRCD